MQRMANGLSSPLAIHVPHMDALAPLEHHWQRVVVVRSVPLLECDEPLGFAAGWLRRRLEAERAPCRHGRESAGRAEAERTCCEHPSQRCSALGEGKEGRKELWTRTQVRGATLGAARRRAAR